MNGSAPRQRERERVAGGRVSVVGRKPTASQRRSKRGWSARASWRFASRPTRPARAGRSCRCTLNHQPPSAPLNQQCPSVPLRLDDAPIKGSLAQFLYIDCLSAKRKPEYAKVLAANAPETIPFSAVSSSRCSTSAASSASAVFLSSGASAERRPDYLVENTKCDASASCLCY